MILTPATYWPLPTLPCSLQRLWYPRYITPLYPDNISALYLDELKGGDQHILNAPVDSLQNGWGVALLSTINFNMFVPFRMLSNQARMTKVSFCDKINHDNYHPHQPEPSQPNLMLSQSQVTMTAWQACLVTTGPAGSPPSKHNSLFLKYCSSSKATSSRSQSIKMLSEATQRKEVVFCWKEIYNRSIEGREGKNLA